MQATGEKLEQFADEIAHTAEPEVMQHDSAYTTYIDSFKEDVGVARRWLLMIQRITRDCRQPGQPWMLDFTEFQQTIGAGIKDAATAVDKLLDPLGLCLQYQGNVRSNTVVVHPQALTDMFKCLFTERAVTTRIRQLNGLCHS